MWDYLLCFPSVSTAVHGRCAQRVSTAVQIIEHLFVVLSAGIAGVQFFRRPEGSKINRLRRNRSFDLFRRTALSPSDNTRAPVIMCHVTYMASDIMRFRRPVQTVPGN